ncbi:WD40-repeat-containing domain protein [Russula earlei]|uniref:WD40-repeat-containing domain protein n=1 Tax=Russula earlei TaxID=71964 RepID=A0ACC0UNF0_9AGAM|nr:WD40-repeat-containing domain protein [Russula earlei]
MKPTVTEDEFEDAEEENKFINEEYKIWKKNAPYLYDLMITHALDWPSLTCQWFPDKESPPNKPYTMHRLLLGTHTSGQAADYLQIATVQIPSRSGPGADVLDRSSYDDERGELGGYTLPASQARINVVQRINHSGEVNRARYMPQNPDLIATKAVSGDVLVFDRTKHPSEPERGGVCKPDIRLVGQTKEGFGLAWNPNKKGHILGASEDKTVCHWDVNAYSKANSSIEPLNVFDDHTAVVGDVDWHATNENVFASVGDDKMLKIWDTRQKPPTSSIQAHDQEILAVAFNPGSETHLITGSADKTILLHDIKRFGKPLHTFEAHTDEVLHLAWSPHSTTIFASASSDRRIHVWDLSQIGVEQTPDDQEDGPPELMFIHGGHTARPSDFCWAPGVGEHWTAVSTSEDNVVMVWQPTMHVWAGDEVHIEEKQLESEQMEGVEVTGASGSGTGRGTGSGMHSAPMSGSASASGGDMDES